MDLRRDFRIITQRQRALWVQSALYLMASQSISEKRILLHRFVNTLAN